MRNARAKWKSEILAKDNGYGPLMINIQKTIKSLKKQDNIKY